MKQKKWFVCLMSVVFLLTVMGTGLVSAKGPKEGNPQCPESRKMHGKKGKRGAQYLKHGKPLEKRIEHLTKKLDLTDKQKKEIQEIFAGSAKEKEEIMKEMKEKMKEVKEKIKERTEAVRKRTDEKIQSVLNSEQRKKYDGMKSEQKEKQKERLRKRKEGLEQELQKVIEEEKEIK